MIMVSPEGNKEADTKLWYEDTFRSLIQRAMEAVNGSADILAPIPKPSKLLIRRMRV
jgi:hypothetical protein